MAGFRQFEHAAWESKAHRYADTWGALTAQPMEAVLDAARVGRGTLLLDCGCGPGHLTHLAALRGAEPTGCDYAEAMLRIARANYPALDFIREDAENLSFADRSFDAVVLNYLLLHVENQRRALEEAVRVLRPGGRLAFSLWLRPAESPGLALIFDALKQHADMSVIPPADDIFLYSDTERAKEFFAAHDFSDLSFARFDTEWRVPSFDAFFSGVQAGTRMGGLIDHQSPEIKQRIKGSMAAAAERFRSGEGYIIPTPSIIASGSKP